MMCFRHGSRSRHYSRTSGRFDLEASKSLGKVRQAIAELEGLSSAQVLLSDESYNMPPGPSARDDELKGLYRERDAKFEKIVLSLARELHTDTTCLTKMDWEQFVEEAEELTDNWAVAETENKLPTVGSQLQRLLSGHQEICKRILKILDFEQPGH